MPRPSATLPNPAFYQDEEVRDAVLDVLVDLQDLYAALPEDYGFDIPEEGAWICVTYIPHTDLDWDVPMYSIWRARRHYRTREFVLKVPRRTKVQWPMLRAVITTPKGELTFLPGEYSVVKDVSKFTELMDDGVDLHFLGAGEPPEFTHQMFYLRSRGLSKAQAVSCLLPDLTETDYCYLTLDLGDGS